MAIGSLSGLRVLALENRRAVEIEKLIRTYGGEPTVTPALREIPLESNHEALEFGKRLLAGEFDLVIFLTGVGVRRLMEILASRYDRSQILDALRNLQVATRGPKPSAAVREIGVPIAITAPEPCTWHEMIGALDTKFGPALPKLRTAVQEYGKVNQELLDALSRHHVQWTRVPVYQWALPENLEPLRRSIRSIAAREVDVVIFLTAVQVVHLFQVAEEMKAAVELREGLRDSVVLSIGPSTTEELLQYRITPDLEPSRPKMGILINEAAAAAKGLLQAKGRSL